MKIFLPPLQIGPTEGFAPEKDIFGRAALGHGLTNLVSRVTDPTVIAVDAQWGSGKTTFLHMWAGELRKSGFPVVFFDAFENDFMEDAFAAIAGQIIALAEEKSKGNEPRAKEFLSKAYGVGKILLRSGLKVGTKAATLGALDYADVEMAATDVAKEISELEDRYLGELLTKQRQEKATIDGFRTALSELPKLLSEDESESKPLIFIIDELDRCRPTFALDILERIKHFFSVPKVQFILGAHIDHLCSAVHVRYGQNIDARLYLQKLIHITVLLHDTAGHAHELTSTKFLNYLVNQHDFANEDYSFVHSAVATISHVTEVRNLSLRTVERIVSVLSLALAFTPNDHFRPAPIITGLAILRVVDQRLYVKAKIGHLKYDEIRDILGLSERSMSSDRLEYDIALWRYCLEDNIDHKEFSSISSQFGYSLNSRSKIIPKYANDVVDRLTERN